VVHLLAKRDPRGFSLNSPRAPRKFPPLIPDARTLIALAGNLLPRLVSSQVRRDWPFHLNMARDSAHASRTRLSDEEKDAIKGRAGQPSLFLLEPGEQTVLLIPIVAHQIA